MLQLRKRGTSSVLLLTVKVVGTGPVVVTHPVVEMQLGSTE